MNKLELLVTLVRAIDNSPKGKFTLSGPEPNSTGDIKRPRPGVLGHTDQYAAHIDVGRSCAHANINKPYETPDENWIGSKHPEPPTPDECIEALFEDALVRAERLRREMRAHLDLVEAALAATGRDLSEIR